MDLSALSLRKAERGLVAGGVGSGKSTLAEALVVDFYRRYPTSLILILDSKPRFRAEYEVSGRPASRRYAKWDHGPKVPGSVVVVAPDELGLALKTGARVIIAQARTSADFPALVSVADAFYGHARSSRPQLLYVDETMDFFRTNTSMIGGDALVRTARSGRELGLSGLYCSQRTKGIPAQLMEYLEKLYMFRLDYSDDVKRTWEMGAPRDLLPPEEKRQFRYWTKAAYTTTYGPYQLQLGRQPPPAGVTPVIVHTPKIDAIPEPAQTAVPAFRRRRRPAAL